MEDHRVLLQRALIRVNGKLGRAIKKQLERFNLSGAEYGIIRNLEDSALTLSELSQRLLRVNSNTTAMIDALERKGLVERIRDAEDRRVIRVKLTGSGLKLRNEVVPSHNHYVNSLLTPLNDTEIMNLLALLEKLEAICDEELS
jgi:DNA-binding MarR family transcriptional regulator